MTNVLFADITSSLASENVWEYEIAATSPCPDVASATADALLRPDDFPPLKSAIVPGDHVVLAVDPNVPEIVQTIRGVMRALAETEAEQVDVVLWDEASDQTLAAIDQEFGPLVRVVRHQSSSRKSLCYLAADEGADPIYLNRLLVDADFVLPIVVGRPLEGSQPRDLTGIYPALADSASRVRHRDKQGSTSFHDGLPETTWLLGVQMMLCITATVDGKVGGVTAGTLEAIAKRLAMEPTESADFPPQASLVIASLDGDEQQQTWSNAVRAISAATRYVTAGGTIVLWSDLADPPSGHLATIPEADDELAARQLVSDVEPATADDFPSWDETLGLARTLAAIAAEHRVLVHSRLEESAIESMGLASVASGEQLRRLSRTFPGCGVLRAAQFA